MQPLIEIKGSKGRVAGGNPWGCLNRTRVVARRGIYWLLVYILEDNNNNINYLMKTI
jgi:hypothetical protein